MFLFLWALLYSAFGRYPGDWLAIPKAVKYWMGQHAIARIPGPWYYYFPQLLFYETATVLAAAFAFRGWKRDPFLGFVVFWAVGSLAIYAWAREKVPWLTVHPLLPLTVLAAIGLSNLWRDRTPDVCHAVALPVVGVLLAVNASGMLPRLLPLRRLRPGARAQARRVPRVRPDDGRSGPRPRASSTGSGRACRRGSR